MEGLLELTSRRMQEDPNPLEIKKQLIGIFMASMYYNSAPTIQYLENKNLTGHFLEELISLSEHFTLEYEKRFFNIGICKMLMSPQLPAAFQPRLLQLLQSVVGQISSLHELVTKRIKAQAQKEANMSDDDSDEDDDLDDDEDSDDEPDGPASQKEETKDADGDTMKGTMDDE